MSFNEWRHRHANYDNRLRGARTPEAQRVVIEQIALQGMQLAVQQNDRAFATAVLGWARTKRIV